MSPTREAADLCVDVVGGGVVGRGGCGGEGVVDSRG